MTDINDFIRFWNEEGIAFEEAASESFADDMFNAFNDMYTYSGANKHRPVISVSNLYKPFGFLMLDKLYALNTEGTPRTFKESFHLMNGHMWEAVIIELMIASGLDVSDLQKTISFHGVPGHIDLIVDDMVIDIKTMNQYYFNKWVKEPNDDRGYLTQILAYREALGIERAAVLAINKFTGELKFDVIRPEDVYTKDTFPYTGEQMLERARTICERQDMNYSIATLYRNFIANIELVSARRGKQLPYGIRYDSKSHMFWKLSADGYVKETYDEPTALMNLQKKLQPGDNNNG